MRSLRAILTLSAWALAAPCLAQGAEPAAPSPKDTTTIKSCVESALRGPDVSARQRACIGLVSKPCRETQDGATTVGMSACIDREHWIWDKLLNQNYQKLMSILDDKGKIDLKSAQQAWLKFRDQACGWPYQIYRGGTLAGPLSGECMMDMTALRALDLEEILDNLN